MARVVNDQQTKVELAIESVKVGDRQAYEIIIHQFERPMYTYCYYILKNHAETEDAVQEIFIRAYEHLHQYRKQTTFSAWLYKLAYHHLMNIKKKQSRWLNLIHRHKEQELVVEVSHYASMIDELLTYLTPEERHILLLRAVEQYSFEEISDIMDIKSATLRKKYERLRHKLLDHEPKGEVASGAFIR
ncbi:RNA polymerase sigma factor [Paenibacillus sp. ACRSA]|uniref:RNA polymerase sigma factor n=1 Tax=Paenibacillus sp. ACRSA TaxID=2918211 RepID=UPI001EF4E7DE|nr:RNA polymerase sigma factor [Paenibacillus sp. ACRSA]MCG7375437.1 RNA polymerase sigma factor [Paenibacillus sp. ACRSA]